MKRILLASLLVLSFGAVKVHAQDAANSVPVSEDVAPSESPSVDGIFELKLTELRPDVIVREETLTVQLPANEPLVEYVFTDHGATLRHAKLLNPKFTREELPMAQDWVPKSKLEGGPIDLVSTCLLYTSPSPRDVEESRMPSSA